MTTKIILILGFIGAIIGGVWLLDDRNEVKFARADDLKSTKILLADSLRQINISIQKTNARIDQRALQDQATYIRRQMQEIRVQCKTANAYQMPPDARKRYNEYKIQLDQINLKMRGKQ